MHIRNIRLTIFGSLVMLSAALLLAQNFPITRGWAQTDTAQNTAQQNRQATRERQQRMQDLDAKMKNPGMLLLRAAEFDPLQNVPVALRIGNQQLEVVKQSAGASRLAFTSSAGYFIVQFPDRILPAQTDSLRARGYEIKGYIPNNAYILKAARNKQTQLLANRSREFRWVGAYGAALKIQPELAQLANAFANGTNTESSEFIRIAFTTFAGEKSADIKTALSSINFTDFTNITERFDGVTTGLLAVPPSVLSRLIVTLANVEGIEWIERHELPKPENDNAVKIIQSGSAGSDTPLFRNGLTGAGQIVGIADSGIDGDNAQFRFSGDASAQTLSYATTLQNLVNGELPFAVTNPNNKVLTYYVLGAGALIDNAANPNGGKVLNPDEQSGGSYLNAAAYDDSNGYHGTHTTSVLAGRDYNADGTSAVPGIANRTSGDGVAPDARLVFQDIGHPGTTSLVGLRVGRTLMFQQAYQTGARIHTNSYGGSAGASYDTNAASTDEAMWRLRDFTIFYSAGNSGPNTNTLTKDTKNAILAGGARTPTSGGSIEDLSSASSHGPTLDGRIKPDITTLYTVRAATEILGQSTTFTYQTSTTALDASINPIAPNNNRALSTISGTSFSSPMAAGGGALVRQYFTDGFYPTGAKVGANAFNPTNALIKAIILNSGRNMTGTYTADDAPSAQKASLPSMGQGWGRMALDDALYFTGDRRELKVIADIWNGATASDSTRPATNAAIQTGQTHTYQITNVSAVEPLRISLVWTDPKGSTAASIALINNLDLEVIDPAGNVFRGNTNFKEAYTLLANGASFDAKNPVEAVYIQYPAQGTYTIKVIGANVPGNGQLGVIAQPGNQTIDSNRQGYALLATGNFSAPVTFNSVTVNGASFQQTETAPGALVSVFGAGLPNGTTINQGVTAFPLPTTVNGVSVRVNGILAPLLFVGAGANFGSNGAYQINFQLPFETNPGNASVVVTYNSVPVSTEVLTVRASSPGLFSFTGDGAGQAAVLNQDYQPNGAARPEARGRVIQIYATGTGAALLDNATRLTALPATGTAPPGDGSKLYVTNFTPTVTIGGVAATVEFSGLAPGFVGLWQINARLPANAPTGNAVPLVIGANGRNSNQPRVAIN